MPASPRLPVRAVIALAIVGYLLLAVTYPLVDPDEGRNAEVAREMVAGGDLVIPHLAGMPYLDKPPGLFWAAALPIRMLGTTPFAARLPSVVAALLVLLAIARLAVRDVDHAFARRAVALTAAAPLFAVLAAYVIFDMPLTLCVTVLWTAIAREVLHGEQRGRRAVMFMALAAGFLIKGPVMLGWALGGSLASALLLRSRAPLRWLGWWPGWVIVATVAGGWFALASRRFPEYPHYAFLEESLERATSGSFHRDQPWWFVPAVFLGGALPWSLVTPWWRPLPSRDAATPGSSAERRRVIARVALGFVLFAAVFFTLSRSKLVTYLLPAIPPLAWLAAEAWSDPRPRRLAAWTLCIFYVLLALAFEVQRSVTFVPPGPTPAMLEGWRVTALTFACAAALALLAALWRRAELTFAAALLFTPTVLVADAPQLLRLAASQSGEPLARAITDSGGGPIVYDGCYSPGTDYRLGGGSVLVSEWGAETTSNYQLRYRRTLIERGLWAAVAAPPSALPGGILVRPTQDAGAPEPGSRVVFRDARFTAYRLGR